MASIFVLRGPGERAKMTAYLVNNETDRFACPANRYFEGGETEEIMLLFTESSAH
jgi:hypothetical protein